MADYPAWANADHAALVEELLEAVTYLRGMPQTSASLGDDPEHLKAIIRGLDAEITDAMNELEEAKMALRKPTKHDWVMQDDRAKYATVYKCPHCKCSKHVEWTEGWPPWDTFYTADGEYTAGEGRTEPPCR